MNKATTRCGSCGEVRLYGHAYTVGIAPDSGVGYFRFSCPHCGLEQRRAASVEVISVLLILGASPVFESVPGPISHAEIDAFAVELAGDWWAELG